MTKRETCAVLRGICHAIARANGLCRELRECPAPGAVCMGTCSFQQEEILLLEEHLSSLAARGLPISLAGLSETVPNLCSPEPASETGMFTDVGSFSLTRSDSIAELDLSVRSYNSLRRSGIHTIGQLLEKSPSQLRTLKSLSTRCLDELQQVLSRMGLRLASDMPVTSSVPDPEAMLPPLFLDDDPPVQP